MEFVDTCGGYGDGVLYDSCELVCPARGKSYLTRSGWVHFFFVSVRWWYWMVVSGDGGGWCTVVAVCAVFVLRAVMCLVVSGWWERR